MGVQNTCFGGSGDGAHLNTGFHGHFPSFSFSVCVSLREGDGYGYHITHYMFFLLTSPVIGYSYGL